MLFLWDEQHASLDSVIKYPIVLTINLSIIIEYKFTVIC